MSPNARTLRLEWLGIGISSVTHPKKSICDISSVASVLNLISKDVKAVVGWLQAVREHWAIFLVPHHDSHPSNYIKHLCFLRNEHKRSCRKQNGRQPPVTHTWSDRH